MAFSAPIWEVRTTGSDSNGGGFDTSATGFPTDGAATLATSAAPVFSSASYNFVSGDISAWIFIKSGTNWTPGWYQITGLSGNSAILDAAVGHAVRYSSAASPSRVVDLNIVAGCATTASPSSATWGIDYSQQDNPKITFTDMVIGGTTTQFTSAAFPVGKNYIGNVINITSGTGFTVQRVFVQSTSGTTATCDKSLGTGGSTGGNGKLGGAIASPGLPNGTLIVTNTSIFVKSGSYTISSTTAGATGGVFSSSTQCRFEGYGTYRGDMGTAPVLTASGISTTTILTFATTTAHTVRNFTIDGANLTAIKALSMSGLLTQGITVQNCTNGGVYVSCTSAKVIGCIVTACSTAGAAFDFNSSSFNVVVNCVAYNNSVPGFQNLPNGGAMLFCLAASNSGASSDGYIGSAGGVYFLNCVAYGNGRDGFQNSSDTTHYLNCIAESNGRYGFNDVTGGLSGQTRTTMYYCATYNNTTDAYNSANFPQSSGHLIAGSASFFTNAAGGDFTLATTSPCKAAGFPGTLLSGNIGYIDIGALQAKPVGGGGAAGGGARLLNFNLGVH